MASMDSTHCTVYVHCTVYSIRKQKEFLPPLDSAVLDGRPYKVCFKTTGGSAKGPTKSF